MTRFIALTLWIVFLGGCAHIVGYAGQHPGFVRCKGKGQLSGTGAAYLGAGIGGGGQNSFTLLADCGEGFELEQGKAPAPAK